MSWFVSWLYPKATPAAGKQSFEQHLLKPGRHSSTCSMSARPAEPAGHSYVTSWVLPCLQRPALAWPGTSCSIICDKLHIALSPWAA